MIRRLALVAFTAAVILGSCFPLLSGRRYAFRDVSHFYLPLYDYVADRTAAEWLPLWNPLDHMGMPLIGESSTAVLYPIRFVIYSLPLSSEAAMNAYLLFHLLLAAATAAWLAAEIGCSRLGVCVAALVYPLSGSIFSLCCNPPFLVGAAWIPLVLGACLGRRPSESVDKSMLRPVALTAIALSMMILGGDAQSALHCVIVVAGFALLQRGIQFTTAKQADQSGRRGVGLRSLTICLSGCVLASGLSAIQIAASLDWGRQSDRVLSDGRRAEIYDFSLPPWHTLDLVSPRPFGHPFPINRRLAKWIPGEGRMWTPSIYAGFLVGFALLCRLFKPRSYFSEPWFALAVISLSLCFGHFGLAWIVQQIPSVMADQDSAMGGPYWLLVQFVPGYSSFRYPVKWLPMFAIASSMVAAQWISTRPSKHERVVAIALGVAFALGAAIAHFVSQTWTNWYEINRISLPIDEYWGPLDVARGVALIQSSCLWSLLLIPVVLRLRRASLFQKTDAPATWVFCGWLILIAADCGLNAATLLPTVEIRRELEIAHQASPSPIPFARTLRTQAGNWPDRWRGSHSPRRALEVAASERMAWFGRWHLARRQAVFNSMVSIRSHEFGEFWKAYVQHIAGLDRDEQSVFWAVAREWLAIGAISHVDATRAIAVDGMSLVYVDRQTTQPVEAVRVWTNWRAEAPLASIIGQIGQDGAVPLPHLPFSATSDRPVEFSESKPSQTLSAHWTRRDDGRIRVSSDFECVLERCVFQDGNWMATRSDLMGKKTVRVPVLRSSHLNQAVRIPAGDWLVAFEYHPWWLTPTVSITAAAAIGVVVCLFGARRLSTGNLGGIVFSQIPGRLRGVSRRP